METRKGMTGGHRAVGATDTWLTPQDILLALGHFDLDPCAAPSPRPWSTADRMIELPDDGLMLPWAGRVWLNPPYGKLTGRWLDRLAIHGQGTALVFARVETSAWFHAVWPIASALFFPRGRITFCDCEGRPGKYTGGAPSALIAYGDRDARILEACGLDGYFLHLPPPRTAAPPAPSASEHPADLAPSPSSSGEC